MPASHRLVSSAPESAMFIEANYSMDMWAIAGFDCELSGCGWPKGLNRLFAVAERRLSRFQYTG
jgi:hypothetical protein